MNKLGFEALDGWIVGLLTVFCDWAQRFVGIRARDWECGCLLLCVVNLLALHWYRGVLVHVVDGFISLLFLVWFQNATVRPDVGSSGGAIHMEEDGLGSTGRTLRLILGLGFFFGDLYAGNYWDYWYQISVAAAYFSAVKELPPGQSKLSKAIERMRPIEPVTA